MSCASRLDSPPAPCAHPQSICFQSLLLYCAVAWNLSFPTKWLYQTTPFFNCLDSPQTNKSVLCSRSLWKNTKTSIQCHFPLGWFCLVIYWQKCSFCVGPAVCRDPAYHSLPSSFSLGEKHPCAPSQVWWPWGSKALLRIAPTAFSSYWSFRAREESDTMKSMVCNMRTLGTRHSLPLSL